MRLFVGPPSFPEPDASLHANRYAKLYIRWTPRHTFYAALESFQSPLNKTGTMLAMNYRGPYRVRADRNKPMPEIKHPQNAIVRMTRACIYGSDLHICHGLVPDTRVGITLEHEFISKK